MLGFEGVPEVARTFRIPGPSAGLKRSPGHSEKAVQTSVYSARP